MAELLQRGVIARIRQLMASVPVVVVEGPRASGKSALASLLVESGVIKTIADLSEPSVREAASASPTSFVRGLATPALIDEAQLVPEIVLAVKQAVDRSGDVGAFLLTGSSRLGRAGLGGSDPLAGRSARIRMWPMTQSELSAEPISTIDALFGTDEFAGSTPELRDVDLFARIRRGGLPLFAGVRAPIDELVRPQLLAEYVEGVLHHEVGGRRDRAEIERTFRYLASTTARLLNVSSVAGELGAKRETVQSRIDTLESTFLVHGLASHRSGEHRMVTAHPKMHAVDTALAVWAGRFGGQIPAAPGWGSLVETFVVNEVCAQASWSAQQIQVRHWRDNARKLEVDAVLLRSDGSSVAVEVKAGVDVRSADLAGLRAMMASDSSVVRGVVYYSGDRALRMHDRIWALPIASLWSPLNQ